MNLLPDYVHWENVSALIEFEKVAAKAASDASVAAASAADCWIRTHSAGLAEELLTQGQELERALCDVHTAPFTLVKAEIAISSLPEVPLTRDDVRSRAETMRKELDDCMTGNPTFRRELHALSLQMVEHGSARLHEGNWFLPRSQDLFKGDTRDAFTEAETAAERLLKRERLVLVLSHGWRSGPQPDPDGKELMEVRKYLKELKQKSPETLNNCSLFYE